MSIILFLDKITKTFTTPNGSNTLFKDITISFEQGISYGIQGPSGTGKSTLLHILAAIELPTSGEIFYNQKAYSTFTSQERSDFIRNSLGVIFQNSYLLPELSVIENIMLKGLISGQEYSKTKREAYILLEQLNLADKAESSPTILSGGQAQRVALARALFNKPTFLLADEPTAHLDPVNQKLIFDLISKAQKEWDLGIIITSHDSLTLQQSDILYTLQGGGINSSPSNSFPAFEDFIY